MYLVRSVFYMYLAWCALYMYLAWTALYMYLAWSALYMYLVLSLVPLLHVTEQTVQAVHSPTSQSTEKTLNLG